MFLSILCMFLPIKLIFSAQTGKWYIPFNVNLSWHAWTFLIVYSTAKFKSNGNKASPSFRPSQWIRQMSAYLDLQHRRMQTHINAHTIIWVSTATNHVSDFNLVLFTNFYLTYPPEIISLHTELLCYSFTYWQSLPNFGTTSQWSIPQSVPLRNCKSSILECHLIAINM